MITLEWSVAVVEVFFRGYGQWIDYIFYEESSPHMSNIFEQIDRCYCTGVFCLTDNDEVAYRHTGKIKDVKSLLPSLKHPDSHFIRHAINKDGGDASDFYFAIDYSEHKEICIAEPSSEGIPKDELPNTVRNTLLKIIIGMAIDGYKYDPDDNKNSLTGSKKDSFSDKFNKLGIQISDETIRKYLKEAESFLPQDYKNRKS